MKAFKKNEREGNFWPIKNGHLSPWPCGARVPHGTRGLVGPCGTRPPHGVAIPRPDSHGASPTHLSRSSAVFGHSNSEFESLFRLQTVTPSRTTKTMKLWQMVENSSRKMMTNTTQRMRTKSSVATSFGLETKWMSNRNDRDSIRNQLRSSTSPKHKKHIHTNTSSHMNVIS